MEENKADFLASLGDSISRYGAHVEKNVLPSLRADFRSFHTLVTSVGKILAKKGLLVEDPYRNDQKISEVTPISGDTFTEGEKITVFSIRFGQFDSQLEFLNNYYQFSLDYLTLPRLKNLTGFLRFIKWDTLSPNSNDVNTRVAAEVITKARSGDDPMSVALVNDAIKQLNLCQTRIFEGLKTVLFYKREEYKLLFRSTVMVSLPVAPEEYQGNSEGVMKKVRKEFADHMKGQPFVPELVTEVLEEEFGTSAARLQEELLSKLRLSSGPVAKKTEAKNHKAAILEAVRVLAQLHTNLDSAVRKLKESSAVLEDKAVSLGVRFKIWLNSLIGRTREPLIYYIDILDPSTGAMRQERLNFEEFIVDAAQKSRIFANLATKNNPLFVKLSNKTEDEIFETYERYFLDMAKMVERINSLDAYFKTEVPKERRALVKGVKTEVSAIRQAMSAGNKAKHEYVSAKEEEDQLKRLGIQA